MSSIGNFIALLAHGDDLACQQTCHIVQTVMMPVVVTVPIISGEQQPSPPSFSHSKSRGHIESGNAATKMNQQP
jgi:hypothetical protein